MDITSIMNTVMSSDSLNSISKKTGASKKEVKSVLTSALPLLLAGAKDQADGKSTAKGFEAALKQHSKSNTKDLAGFLGNVDLADGAKIIGHLLGGKTESTTQTLAQSSGASSNNTASILAAAAPLLMSLLGQESEKEEENAGGALVGQLVSSVLSNVNVGDLLMGVLGSDSDKEEEKPKKKKKKTSKKDDDVADKLSDAAGILMNLLK